TFGVHEWGVHQTAGYVNLNEWTHLAITLDDSGNKTYYQNGIEVGTSINTPNTDTDGRIARIGSNPNGDGDFFNGLIDEVYIFNSELTQEQILNVYKTGFHTYDYSCWTGPLEDLSTNVYDIKATDSESNSTTTEAYVEADNFGGLTLKSLW